MYTSQSCVLPESKCLYQFPQGYFIPPETSLLVFVGKVNMYRIKGKIERAGVMGQWLRVLFILVEDLGLVCRTHVVAHNHP